MGLHKELRAVFVLALLAALAGCASKSIQPVSHFPVQPGEVGPVHPQNPLQQPFACTTDKVGLGEPLVDNHLKVGQPIGNRGYSQYCGAPMQVSYYYRNIDGKFVSLPESGLPDDVEMITRDGRQVPFVVRLERGVLNRFIYVNTMLAAADEVPEHPDSSLWNRRLVMFYNGGIGIGHKQAGRAAIKVIGPTIVNDDFMFNSDLLAQGYAVTTSSGMTTETTYHLPLLLQTSELVKRQFEARYGQAGITIGLGGSGGAIQALYNSNQTDGLLDGMLLTHLFPDLLTQINGVGDCELLEYYFDRGHAVNGELDPFWADWDNRRLIEGFNAVNGYEPIKTDISGQGRPLMSTANKGASTCTEGWRLSVPVFFNPRFFLPFTDYQQAWIEQDVKALEKTKWSHWDDAVDLYGRKKNSYAGRTYDNEGVQYGLQALRNGQLSVERFLHLNQRIGGWLPSEQMQLEAAPYYPYGALTFKGAEFWDFLKLNLTLSNAGELWDGTRNLIDLTRGKSPDWLVDLLGSSDHQSVWSHYNGTAWREPVVAKRSQADLSAIRNAEKHQLVFRGQLTKPTIVLSYYLDNHLDMHDARQAFLTRQRVANAGSDTSLMSIWGAQPDEKGKIPREQLKQIVQQGLTSLESWLIEERKPLSALDRCWDADRVLVAVGDGVWNGIEDPALAQGACSVRFAIHSNPRVQAGEPFVADTLKCALEPVEQAISKGVYGAVTFTAAQRQQLQATFPSGVCNYAQPGVERITMQ